MGFDDGLIVRRGVLRVLYAKHNRAVDAEFQQKSVLTLRRYCGRKSAGIFITLPRAHGSSRHKFPMRPAEYSHALLGMVQKELRG